MSSLSPISPMQLSILNGARAPLAKDPSFSSVVLLMNPQGTDGNQDAVELAQGRVITWTTAGIICSNAQQKFGGLSVRGNFPSATNDRLEFVNTADLQFGTGDFTLEQWIYQTSRDPAIWGASLGNFDGSNTGSYSMAIRTDGELTFRMKNLGISLSSGTFNNTLNIWQFYTISRNGDTIRLFLDGVMRAKVTGFAAQSVGSAVPTNWNIHGSVLALEAMRGYIDGTRVTKGVGRYNSDTAFVPPTAPFPTS